MGGLLFRLQSKTALIGPDMFEHIEHILRSFPPVQSMLFGYFCTWLLTVFFLLHLYSENRNFYSL